MAGGQTPSKMAGGRRGGQTPSKKATPRRARNPARGEAPSAAAARGGTRLVERRGGQTPLEMAGGQTPLMKWTPRRARNPACREAPSASPVAGWVWRADLETGFGWGCLVAHWAPQPTHVFPVHRSGPKLGAILMRGPRAIRPRARGSSRRPPPDPPAPGPTPTCPQFVPTRGPVPTAHDARGSSRRAPLPADPDPAPAPDARGEALVVHASCPRSRVRPGARRVTPTASPLPRPPRPRAPGRRPPPC